MSDFLKILKLWLRLKAKSFGYLFMKAPEPEKWVFILGCYNSGTTLLHKLLATHSDIGSMPNEGQFYSSQLPGGAKFNLPRLWALKPELFYINESSNPSIDLQRLKKEWAWFYNDPKKKVLIEKTILNSARSRWLQKNFRNSYFIVIFRNGYAVAEGIHRKENHAIDIAATQWAISNQILLKDLDYLKHKLIVKYEDLVKSPVGELSKITEFLNLNPLHEEVFKEEFKIHKFQSGIRDMNKESIGRLSVDEVEAINLKAANVLEQLNYVLLNPSDFLKEHPLNGHKAD
jgi:hypothetical protein